MPDHPPSPTKYIVAAGKYQPQSGPRLLAIILILFGLVSVAGYLCLWWLGDLRFKVPEYVWLYFVLSVTYFLACLMARRAANTNHLRLILGFALLFRLVVLFSAPSLSDDVYRYLWEGYLQTQGVNPYRFAPQAAQLVPLRNDLWAKVNNKDAAAIYPPLIQIIQAGVFVLFPSAWAFKLLFLGVEGLLVWFLLRLLILRSMNQCHILFYAWNPLVVIETAGSGHHDVCVAALLLGSVLCCLTGQERKSALLLASSVLSKLYPLITLPFFIKRIRLKNLGWFFAAIVLAYLPYLSAGNQLFSALSYYREKWRFNGFLFLTLSELLADEKLTERMLLLSTGLIVAWCVVRTSDLLEQLYWTTGAVLLCAPTLFPWYLVWMVPLLCFFPNPAWLLLTSLIGLSYYVLINWWTVGIWQQDMLFLELQYYPFYAMLVLNFVWKQIRTSRARRKRAALHGLEAFSEPH
jgi:hypothetical protein